ncbi:signal peptidase I [Actinomyces sp. 2119]|uniref:Signal peptidase I n=2 Tax=Actinomycetaceae TaxID=2049 RepID=A0ABN5PUM4_9ACTO|nr:signal peptidase I [Actinomyces lilanjuaniae]RJF43304.1 signal peptidase I [Actinomyces sp. 2119]
MKNVTETTEEIGEDAVEDGVDDDVDGSVDGAVTDAVRRVEATSRRRDGVSGARRGRAGAGADEPTRSVSGLALALRWGSTLLYVGVAVLLVALFRTFVLQSFIIPSGSMENTLSEGDRVVVTMYDSQDIERGDIVVFTDPDGWLEVTEPSGLQGVVQDVLVAIRILPQDAGHHLIKRVIGMPGDRVVADGQGSLSVNGVEVDEPYIKPGRSASEIAFDVTVPQGYVWVMGDNRSNSADSRLHRDDTHGGFVPLSNVVGVAKAVEWPVTHWTGLGGGREVFRSVPAPQASPLPGGQAQGHPVLAGPGAAVARNGLWYDELCYSGVNSGTSLRSSRLAVSSVWHT